MKRLIATCLIMLPFCAPAALLAATPGVRDSANLFSADACRQADEQLTAIHNERGWEIVFETIESTEGKSPERLALDKARSLQVRGVYVLIARKEHFIRVETNRAAVSVFGEDVRKKLRDTLAAAFKDERYDHGLQEGVSYVAEVALRGDAAPWHREATQPAAGPATVQTRPAPAARSGDDSPARPAPGAAPRRTAFLTTALIVGGAVVGLLLLIRLLSGLGRGAAGGAYPGTGPVGGGGGFAGSLLGGLGGVLLGSWLYDSLFRHHTAHGAEHLPQSNTAMGHHADSGADAFNDQYEGTGGTWDDAGGDGDTGGFDGGDMGGGDFGGGDW